MATLITTCPSCGGPLRVPDELVGRRVRCPSCQTVFHAATPPASEAPSESERPLWKNLQLELGDGDPDTPPAPEAPPRKRGLTGAVEIDSSETKEQASASPWTPEKSSPNRVEQPPPPRPRNGLDDEEDYRPSRRRRYRGEFRRRDGEPHRGPLILVFGIISLAFVAMNFCYGVGILVGLPLGITAWVLGSADLRKIRNNVMDQEGLGMTQAGWICGVIGTVLHSLVLLACGALLTFFVVCAGRVQSNQAPFAKPAPFAPRPVFVPPAAEPENDN